MFPCERCGACCRQIGTSVFGKDMALPDGSCQYLDHKTNLCSIYKERPIYCNVDAYYEKFIYSNMSREEFYSLNKIQCLALRKNLNIH